jgi:hypothetical protein
MILNCRKIKLFSIHSIMPNNRVKNNRVKKIKLITPNSKLNLFFLVKRAKEYLY